MSEKGNGQRLHGTPIVDRGLARDSTVTVHRAQAHPGPSILTVSLTA